MGPKSTIATNFLNYPNGTTNAGIIIAQILLSREKVERRLQCRRGVTHGVDDARKHRFVSRSDPATLCHRRPGLNSSCLTLADAISFGIPNLIEGNEVTGKQK
jgi:hypothetical protein